MSMLFAYMAVGEVGRGFEVLKCFVRRGKNFFYLCVCVCKGGGGQVQYLTFREKDNQPLLLINDWSL